MNARDELAADISSATDHWELPIIGTDAEKIAVELEEKGYSKPRTITTIGDLSGERAGTVILTAHGRIFEYTSRNWLAPGFMTDYQPIIDWLPATVIHEP